MKQEILAQIRTFIEQRNTEKTWEPGKDFVNYAGPFFDAEEIVAAAETLLDGWLVMGNKSMLFERRFPKLFGKEFGILTNSGSSSNLLMMASLTSKRGHNFPKGTKVLMPIAGFPTTLNPTLQVGFTPVFVDIELDTLNIDVDHCERVLANDPDIKVITFAHVLGNPPDMDKLLEISNKYGIQLIMDGCDSFGSKWKDKDLCEYAIATSCSFYPAHHITTGEGGMVSSNIEEIIKLARSFSWWGRDCFCIGQANLLKNGSCNCRFSNWIKELPYQIDHKYFFTQIGYNLKPLDLQGGIGLAQLKKSDKFHEIRKTNKKTIQSILESIKSLKFPSQDERADVSWFGVPVICDSYLSKNKLVNYLESNGIQTRNYFAGNILLHPAYSHLEHWSNYPNANGVLEKVFFIGCSPTITSDNIEYIREVISKYEN